MMHNASLDDTNIVVPERQTRQAAKIVFKQQRLICKRYIKSPYIRGINLWGKLSCETQRMENKFEYKKVISVRLTTYNENYLDSDVNANNLIDGN